MAAQSRLAVTFAPPQAARRKLPLAGGILTQLMR
jgi:hypothetical protein